MYPFDTGIFGWALFYIYLRWSINCADVLKLKNMVWQNEARVRARMYSNVILQYHLQG